MLFGLIINGLEEIDSDSIISILSKNPKVESIILFGSRAKGNYNPGSDIDLAIKGDQLKLQDVIEFQLEIDKLYLPNKVDILLMNRIEERALIDHINRVGIVLFQREC